MKKLLSVLGAVALSGTATASVVACGSAGSTTITDPNFDAEIRLSTDNVLINKDVSTSLKEFVLNTSRLANLEFRLKEAVDGVLLDLKTGMILVSDIVTTKQIEVVISAKQCSSKIIQLLINQDEVTNQIILKQNKLEVSRGEEIYLLGQVVNAADLKDLKFYLVDQEAGLTLDSKTGALSINENFPIKTIEVIVSAIGCESRSIVLSIFDQYIALSKDKISWYKEQDKSYDLKNLVTNMSYLKELQFSLSTPINGVSLDSKEGTLQIDKLLNPNVKQLTVNVNAFKTRTAEITIIIWEPVTFVVNDYYLMDFSGHIGSEYSFEGNLLRVDGDSQLVMGIDGDHITAEDQGSGSNSAYRKVKFTFWYRSLPYDWIDGHKYQCVIYLWQHKDHWQTNNTFNTTMESNKDGQLVISDI